VRSSLGQASERLGKDVKVDKEKAYRRDAKMRRSMKKRLGKVLKNAKVDKPKVKERVY
jgi:hypothetical protein